MDPSWATQFGEYLAAEEPLQETRMDEKSETRPPEYLNELIKVLEENGTDTVLDAQDVQIILATLRAKESGSAGPGQAWMDYSIKRIRSGVPQSTETHAAFDAGYTQGHAEGWSACREAAAKVCLGDCPGLVYKRKMNHLECATVIERLQPPKE